jgi:hypothetical protein
MDDSERAVRKANRAANDKGPMTRLEQPDFAFPFLSFRSPARSAANICHRGSRQNLQCENIGGVLWTS